MHVLVEGYLCLLQSLFCVVRIALPASQQQQNNDNNSYVYFTPHTHAIKLNTSLVCVCSHRFGSLGGLHEGQPTPLMCVCVYL